jgi:hypothetical protein
MQPNTNEPDLTRRPQEARNAEVTYDETDLSVRAVVLFLVLLAIGGILVIILLWGAYRYVAGGAVPPRTRTNPLTTSPELLAPIGGDQALRFPEPRLQRAPVADLDKFRAAEDQILNTYGWVDQANGRVHIPIDRAMDMLPQEGLPTRADKGR